MTQTQFTDIDHVVARLIKWGKRLGDAKHESDKEGIRRALLELQSYSQTLDDVTSEALRNTAIEEAK